MASRPTDGREKRVCVAQIGGAHGLKGEVRLWSYTEEPSAVARYGALETEDGSRRLAIAQLRPAKDHFVARLRGVDDRDAAEALRNVRLYVARDCLPETEDNDTFYHADLIGLSAFDAGGERIGEVVAVQNFGAGDIIEVRRASGGTTLYPFHAAVVPEIDVAAGRMTIVAPVEIEGEDTDSESPPPLRGRPAAKRPGGG
jgi:16S rRNA processing protein RimM